MSRQHLLVLVLLLSSYLILDGILPDGRASDSVDCLQRCFPRESREPLEAEEMLEASFEDVLGESSEVES